MGRTHIIQHWSDAAAYSGEIIGNRLEHSQELHMVNGKANIALYADEDKPQKAKPSAFERACLADRHYTRLEKLKAELDAEYYAHKLSHEDWVYASRQLDARLQRAWQRISKARGWDSEETHQNSKKEVDVSPKWSYYLSQEVGRQTNHKIDSLPFGAKCFRKVCLYIWKTIKGVML